MTSAAEERARAYALKAQRKWEKSIPGADLSAGAGRRRAVAFLAESHLDGYLAGYERGLEAAAQAMCLGCHEAMPYSDRRHAWGEDAFDDCDAVAIRALLDEARP